MSIIRIAEFQKAYPRLWNKINGERIKAGRPTLEKEYSEEFSVPIRMFDASLAERCLEVLAKNELDLFNPEHVIGYKNLTKIIQVASIEPNMFKWLDRLYYPKNPKGLFTDRYNAELKIKKPKKQNKKDTKMAKARNIVDGEIIVTVSNLVDGSKNTTYVATDESGKDYTDQINQKKLKYAFTNKGVVRGRQNPNGVMVWRVVKEKYIVKTEPENVNVAPATNPGQPLA